MRRPRHVPQRSCVACRQVRPKTDLVRIVRTPLGEVKVDVTGKLAGRGAYLCGAAACVEQALKQRKLVRALGVAVGEDVVREIRASASGGARSAEGQTSDRRAMNT